MKSFALITSLVLSAFASTAQSSQPAEENNSRPVISKGYYSIGDHAKKLPAANPLRFFKTSVEKDQPRKGYYAIESRPQTKLTYQLQQGSGDKPKKGYHSISGSNQ
jgi:hypothetical protein